jgi:magnesium-transporting ATPase (P-type)
MNNELFQDLAKIKISHPTKNKDQKPAGKRLKAFIVFLYAISILLLYVGITMPVNTQISLSAMLFNIKKIIVLGIVGLLSLIICKLSKPFFSENPKIVFSKAIFSLIFILIMVLFVLPHLVFNTKNIIMGSFYFVESLLMIVVVLTGLNILDLFIS